MYNGPSMPFWSPARRRLYSARRAARKIHRLPEKVVNLFSFIAEEVRGSGHLVLGHSLKL